MPQNYQVLLIDISNIFYRSYCALDVCTEQGVDISGLYGAVNTIQSQIKAHNPTVVVGVFDGKGGTDRKKKIIEGYKDGRRIPTKLNYFINRNPINPAQLAEQQRDFQSNFLWQMRKLNEMLSHLPIQRVVVEGYEADEVIAYLCQSYYKEKNLLIVSEDKDYHQLVSDRVNVWNFHEMVTPQYNKRRWGTNYGSIVNIIRLMDGDKSDKINGIYGFGIKTIEKFFPSLLERQDIETVDNMKEYLIELATEIATKKTGYSKNWKTVLAKVNHLLTGEDKTGLTCMEILERNYKVMQLREPEIDARAKMKILDFIKLEVEFNPVEYKKMVVQEGLTIKGNSLLAWEIQFKNLQYNQLMYLREQNAKESNA